MSELQHPRENEVLQLCACLRLTETQSIRLKELLRLGLDWNYLCGIAQRHALLPLLFSQLNQTAASLIPADAHRRLKLKYQENAARNIILTNELLDIVQDLEANGIQSLPFKGPVLATLAYGNSALRTFVDLDLIVHRRDVDAARNILVARGYQFARSLDPRQEQLLLAGQHNFQFVREEGRLIVELHWRVSADLFAGSVPPDDLWDNLETIDINGVKVNTMPAEDIVFALSVHGSRHVWERLSWICDIAALIANGRDVNWEHLFARVISTDTERMLLLGLHLASRYTNESLPAEITGRIARDKTVKRLAMEITNRLFNEIEPSPLTAREMLRFNLSIRKSWLARARYLLFAMSPGDRDVDMIALPRVLNFVYFGLRPFRLLRSQSRNQPTRKESQMGPL